MSKQKECSNLFEYLKKNYKEIELISVLGKGGFGEVWKCKYNEREVAVKLEEKHKSNKIPLDKLIGKNIIKIIKTSETVINDKYYDIIIMELALLRDIKLFFKTLFELKLLKTINNPFDEIVGNNLLRFFTKQIVNGLETFERNGLVHFDIKPENILITSKLQIKISDFGFIKDLNNEKETINIPGGTKGFVPPEYYKKNLIDKSLAKKQDYFALGSTLFFLKFNKPLLHYKESSSLNSTNIHVIHLLQKSISFIKSNCLLDKDFISFLCSLIEYLPEDRPNFEEIYRNKWLNENTNEINELTNLYFENDERKLTLELIKSDFLIEKKKKNKNIKKSRFKFVK